MRSFLLLGCVALPCMLQAQGTFCDPQGNVALFSNYDGGALTINVDQDIPDLRIGIVSYEFAVINVTGPYASNITEILWAGFNGMNDHCGTGSVTHATVITGAPAGTAQLLVYPPATLANPHGWPNILCAYSCDIGTDQGGCNTVDQIAHFFLSQWGGSLYFHRTQYGCWNGTWNLSDGGNCCVDPLSIGAQVAPHLMPARPVPASEEIIVSETGPFVITDALGRPIRRVNAAQGTVDVRDLAPGSYQLLSEGTGHGARFVVER